MAPISLINRIDDNTIDETEESTPKTVIDFEYFGKRTIVIFGSISFQSKKLLNNIKIALLVAVWILFTGILMLQNEKVLENHQLVIPISGTKS